MAKFTNELTLDIKPFLNAIRKAVSAAGGDVDKLEKELKGIDLTLDTSKVSGDLKGITKEAAKEGKKAGDSFKEAFSSGAEGLSDAFSGGLAGGIIGGGIAEGVSAGATAIIDGFGAVIDSGRELITAQGDLQAATGATGEEFEALKDAAETAFDGGVGESLAEATRAIIQAENLLGDVFNPEQLGEYTAQANALAGVYDKDVNEVLRLSSTLVKQYGLDNDEAFEIIADGLANAGSAQDDYLDSIAEYSQLAKEAGLSAQEFNEVLIRGGQEGVFNTDKIADSVKELQIRLNAGDIAKGLSEVGNVPAALSASLDEVVALGEQGVISSAEVLQRSTQAIEEAFNAGEIADSTRAQLQVAFAGTPAEDLGADLYGRIFGAPFDEEAIAARAQAAGESASNAIGQYLTFDSIGRDLSKAFDKASAVVTQGIDNVLGFFQTTLGPVLEDLFDNASGYFERLWSVAQPILAAIGGAIVAGLVTTLQLVTTTLSVVFDVASRVFDAIADALTPLLESFGLLGDTTEKNVDYVQLFTDALAASGEIMAQVGGVVAELAGFVIELAVTGFQTLVNIVSVVIDFFGGLFESTEDVTKVTEEAGEASLSFGEILTNIQGTIAGITSAFKATKEAINEFVRLITSDGIGAALAFFTDIGDKISEGYDEGWNRVVNGAKEATEELKTTDEEARAIFDKISSSIKSFGERAPKLELLDFNEQKERLDKLIDETLAGQKITQVQAKTLEQELNKIRQGNNNNNNNDLLALARERFALATKTAQQEREALKTSLLQNAAVAGRQLTTEEELQIAQKNIDALGETKTALENIFDVKRNDEGIVIDIDAQLKKGKSKDEIEKIIADLNAQFQQIAQAKAQAEIDFKIKSAGDPAEFVDAAKNAIKGIEEFFESAGDQVARGLLDEAKLEEEANARKTQLQGVLIELQKQLANPKVTSDAKLLAAVEEQIVEIEKELATLPTKVQDALAEGSALSIESVIGANKLKLQLLLEDEVKNARAIRKLRLEQVDLEERLAIARVDKNSQTAQLQTDVIRNEARKQREAIEAEFADKRNPFAAFGEDGINALFNLSKGFDDVAKDGEQLATDLQGIFSNIFSDQGDADKVFEAQERELRASLKRREISEEEYRDSVRALQENATKDAVGFEAIIYAGKKQFIKLAEKEYTQAYDKIADSISAQQEILKNGSKLEGEELEALKKRALSVTETWEEIAKATGASFARMVADGESATGALLGTLKTTLKLAAQAFLPTIFANFLSFLPPPFNIGAATAAVGLVTGLIDQFLAFEKGGVIPGGEQLIRVNEKGQEFVANATATAKFRPQLEAMNRGVDPALATDNGRDMLAVIDHRFERLETAVVNLGQEITRKTSFTGTMEYDDRKGTFISRVDSQMQYNKRRSLN